jgi:hypothetical protein
MTAGVGALRSVILGALLASSWGCSSAKREAASLVSVVERYRKASMDGKAAPAEMLEAVACSDSEEACLASSRPTVRGIALKHEVEVALDDLDAGKLTREQALGLGLSSKLDEASRAIEEGRGKLGACDEQVIGLRLKYGL